MDETEEKQLLQEIEDLIRHHDEPEPLNLGTHQLLEVKTVRTEARSDPRLRTAYVRVSGPNRGRPPSWEPERGALRLFMGPDELPMLLETLRQPTVVWYSTTESGSTYAGVYSRRNSRA